MMPFQHRWQRNGLRTVLIWKQSNALKYPAGLERMQQERVHNYMHFVMHLKKRTQQLFTFSRSKDYGTALGAVWRRIISEIAH